MILHLDSSIKYSIFNNTLNETEIESIISIAISKSKGTHFVIANKETIEAIISIPSLGGRVTAIYSQILHEQTKWHNILKKQKYKINLKTNIHDIAKATDQDLITIEMPLNLFFKCDLDNPPDFIAEDHSDIEVYKIFLGAYLQEKNISGVNLKFNAISGGGSNCIDSYTRNIARNKITFCVLDSDKTNPTANIGPTAQKVLDVSNEIGIVRHFILNARELENVIPINNYKKLLNENSTSHCPYLFVDLKKGIKKYNSQCNANLTDKEYWNDSLSIFDSDACTKTCSSFKSCEKILVDGFGSDLLKKIIPHLKFQQFDFSSFSVLDKHHWSQICKELLPYFISPISKVA